MKLARLSGLASTLLLSSLLLGAAAEDWPGLRGPRQDGSVRTSGVFAGDSIRLEIDWSRDLGSAYSGIAVADGRLVTMFADGETDWVIALDPNNGEERWRYRIDAMYAGHDGSDDGPLSTPVVDRETVYGVGARGQLFALQLADGSEIWRVDLREAVGAKPPLYGFTTSPLVVGDLLFVQTGGTEGRAFTGFDRRNGKILWSGGTDRVGYQSPVRATLAGRRQLLAAGNNEIVGIDPESGELLWSRTYADSGSDGSAHPVLVGDDRFLLTGRAESTLLAVRSDDGALRVEEVWRSSSLKGSFATPVLHEGHLYGFDGKFLACVAAETGEQVWKSRPPGGHGLILVDDYLVIFDGKGRVVLAPASPEGYRELAAVQVGESASFTWPSFAAGRIFVRDLKTIVGVRIDTAPAAAGN